MSGYNFDGGYFIDCVADVHITGFSLSHFTSLSHSLRLTVLLRNVNIIIIIYKVLYILVDCSERPHLRLSTMQRIETSNKNYVRYSQ